MEEFREDADLTNFSQEYEVVCTSTLIPCHSDETLGEDEPGICNDLFSTPPSPAWHVSFSRDGLLLATSHASPENCIRIWACFSPLKSKSNDLNDSWRLVCKLSGVHERTIRCTEFGPHHILASASFDGNICIWEPSTENQHNVTSLFQSNSLTLQKYNWECTAQLEGHDNEVKAVAWNAAGSLLATCGRDKTVWVWECNWPNRHQFGSGEGEFDCLAVLNGHEADVKFVTFIQKEHVRGEEGEWLLSASYDNSIKLWEEDEEGDDWYCISTLNGHTNTVWCVSPYWSYTAATNKYSLHMVSASHDSSLAIWKYYSVMEMRNACQTDNAVANTATWRCLGNLIKAHEGAVYSVNCTSLSQGLKNPYIASGGEDNCIHIYQEVSQDFQLPTLTMERPKDDEVKWSPQEKLSKFRRIGSVANAHNGDVNCVRWHPKDGTLLASAGDDGLVKLWKVLKKC